MSTNPSNTEHLLTCLAFRTGYTRAFTATAPPRRGFSLKVYEFGTAAGATRYAAAVVRGTLRLPSAGQAVPPGQLITLDDPDSYGFRVALVVGSTGPYAYVVRTFGVSVAANLDDAIAIAGHQRQQLRPPVS